MSKLTIEDEGFVEQMLQDVQFSPEDLDNAYIEQASLYAYYAHQSMLASRRADNAKLFLNATEAGIDKNIRNDAATEGKKLTEKMIEQEVSRAPVYVSAVKKYNDAKALAQMLRDILDAFKNRKDCLIQYGLSRREEFRSQGLSISAPTEDELTARRQAAAKKGSKSVVS